MLAHFFPNAPRARRRLRDHVPRSLVTVAVIPLASLALLNTHDDLERAAREVSQRLSSVAQRVGGRIDEKQLHFPGILRGEGARPSDGIRP